MIRLIKLFHLTSIVTFLLPIQMSRWSCKANILWTTLIFFSIAIIRIIKVSTILDYVSSIGYVGEEGEHGGIWGEYGGDVALGDGERLFMKAKITILSSQIKMIRKYFNSKK